MGDIAKFAALNTKVKVLEGRLLKKEDYDALLKADTLEEAVEYLMSNTWYGDLMNGFIYNGKNLEELEIMLSKSYFHNLERFFKYMTDSYRKYFKTIFMRYEVENIKIFLRALSKNQPLEGIRSHLLIHNSSKLEYDVLMTSRTVGELIDNLKGTPYHRILSNYADETSETMLFYMEMNLDRLYFDTLKKITGKLKDNDEIRNVGGLLAMNIDMLNLQWIYRGRRYYGLSSEELLNYALGGGKHFKFEDLKKLCYTSSAEELVGIIKASCYGFLFEDMTDFEIYMERSMQRYLYKMFTVQKVKNQMNIVETMIYMHQTEYEIRDLFSIFEMKRYGISGEEGKSFLVKIL